MTHPAQEMVQAYNETLTEYYRFQKGRQEAVSEQEAHHPGPSARIIGAQRWSASVQADSILDNQRVGERQTQLHAQVATVQALHEILTQLKSIAVILEEIRGQLGGSSGI